MSISVMKAVFDLRLGVLTQAESHVLLAAAYHADHEGMNVYPSLSRLAQECKMARRSIQRIIARLVAKGFLIVVGPKGLKRGDAVVTVTKYAIDLDLLQSVAACDPESHGAGGHESQTPRPAVADTSDPESQGESVTVRPVVPAPRPRVGSDATLGPVRCDPGSPNPSLDPSVQPSENGAEAHCASAPAPSRPSEDSEQVFNELQQIAFSQFSDGHDASDVAEYVKAQAVARGIPYDHRALFSAVGLARMKSSLKRGQQRNKATT